MFGIPQKQIDVLLTKLTNSEVHLTKMIGNDIWQNLLESMWQEIKHSFRKPMDYSVKVLLTLTSGPLSPILATEEKREGSSYPCPILPPSGEASPVFSLSSSGPLSNIPPHPFSISILTSDWEILVWKLYKKKTLLNYTSLQHKSETYFGGMFIPMYEYHQHYSEEFVMLYACMWSLFCAGSPGGD